MHVADLLFERAGVSAAEADVASEAPRLHLVAAVLEKQLQRDQRLLIGHEPRQQQHRVAVAALRARQPRQAPRQRGNLDEGTRLDDLVQQARPADVAVSLGHPDSVFRQAPVTAATSRRYGKQFTVQTHIPPGQAG